jgi:hypothetical protein
MFISWFLHRRKLTWRFFFFNSGESGLSIRAAGIIKTIVLNVTSNLSIRLLNTQWRSLEVRSWNSKNFELGAGYGSMTKWILYLQYYKYTVIWSRRIQSRAVTNSLECMHYLHPMTELHNPQTLVVYFTFVSIVPFHREIKWRVKNISSTDHFRGANPTFQWQKNKKS